MNNKLFMEWKATDSVDYPLWLEDRVVALEAMVEKFTSTNNARDEILLCVFGGKCPHQEKEFVK